MGTIFVEEERERRVGSGNLGKRALKD